MKYILGEDYVLNSKATASRSELEETEEYLRIRFKHRVPYSKELFEELNNRKPAAAEGAEATANESPAKRKASPVPKTSKKKKTRNSTGSAPQKSGLENLDPSTRDLFVQLINAFEKMGHSLTLSKNANGAQKKEIENLLSKMQGMAEKPSVSPLEVQSLRDTVVAQKKKISQLETFVSLRESEIELLNDEKEELLTKLNGASC
jgi:hypothetical protein